MSGVINREKIVFGLLQNVFVDKAYGSIVLDKELNSIDNVQDRAYITKLFYGVLDKSIQFDFIISKLCQKPPKMAVKTIIKIGLYLLRYTDTPDYAATNKTVELAKVVGKAGVSGFVNAVLKKSVKITLPDITDALSLSINSSYPLWLVEVLIKDYSLDFVRDMLMTEQQTLTHIRHNGFKLGETEFKEKYIDILDNQSKLGYYVTHNTLSLIDKQDYVIQSLASGLAVKTYYDAVAKTILDLCAAPGGKSIYLKQLYLEQGTDVKIVACDVHAHRVELIKKYANNVGCEIDVKFNDATVYSSEFDNRFDLVVCDVPCSGIGVAGSKPEILFDKIFEDIKSLAKLQLDIINAAARYVKKGGTICYSTCTILKKENDEVIEKFMQKNKNFALQTVDNGLVKADKKGYVRLFPHIDNCDGFFVCKLKRID